MPTQSDTAKASRTRHPRYATKADIQQLTRSLDRIRDDATRYLICMTLDVITQEIAKKAETTDTERESGPDEDRLVAN